MKEKPVILCVDDDQNVVESMTLNLRPRYRVLTALSGYEGLEVLKMNKDISVVISDMRMPEMDGAAFLAEVKSRAPTIVRMLLTGYADIEAAMRAVNEGQIFRFLAKPCSPEHLVHTLEAGVEQHRLITAERILLQKTLLGSVKAIMEIMALGNPLALGRAVRIRSSVRRMTKAAQIDQPWRLEVASLLSQLGSVSLSDDMLHKLHTGEMLESGERARLRENMQTVFQILENIPRLEPVTAILSELAALTDDRGGAYDTVSTEALILKAAIDLDALEAQGYSRAHAILNLEDGPYGPAVVHSLEGLKEAPGELEEISVAVTELRDGMVLRQDLTTNDGILILPRGFVINKSSREHIRNFEGQFADEIKALTPTTDPIPDRVPA